VTRTVRRLAPALALVAIVAGCGLTQVVEPKPGAIPAGPPEAMGGEPTGPVIPIGSGQAQGIGWRYSVYQSADGFCTQLETGSFAGAGCGPGLPDGDTVFGGISSGSGDPNGPTIVDGLVGDEVVEVVLQLEGGDREPAVLMSLHRAGLEGSAFVGFAPPGATVESVAALDAQGNVLEAMDVVQP
jgi:hypothetical protein